MQVWHHVGSTGELEQTFPSLWITNIPLIGPLNPSHFGSTTMDFRWRNTFILMLDRCNFEISDTPENPTFPNWNYNLKVWQWSCSWNGSHICTVWWKIFPFWPYFAKFCQETLQIDAPFWCFVTQLSVLWLIFTVVPLLLCFWTAFPPVNQSRGQGLSPRASSIGRQAYLLDFLKRDENCGFIWETVLIKTLVIPEFYFHHYTTVFSQYNNVSFAL